MSNSTKELTGEEKKRIIHLSVSVGVTGFFAMIGALLRNPYVFSLLGIGLILTVVTLYRMLIVTKLDD